MSVAGCLTTLPALADVQIKQATDRSVTIKADTYNASIDSSGKFSLLVGDESALQQVFKPEAGSTLSVNVVNALVAVRGGKNLVEYSFGPDTIDVKTEGFSFDFLGSDTLKAVLAPNAKGGPFGPNGYEYSSGVVLKNGLTVTYSPAFHVGALGDQRLFPSVYASGQLEPGKPLEFSLKVGQPVEAVNLLGKLQIQGIGDDAAALRQDGNQSSMTQFPSPDHIAFKTSQSNLSDKSFEVNYALSVLDHYIAGKQVFSQEQTVMLEAGKTGEAQWVLPTLPSGFYYLTIKGQVQRKEFTVSRQTFAVDLPHYTHALTRPADFKEFWQTKIEAMRKLPFDAVLKPVAAKSTEAAVHYDLELTGVGGAKVKAALQVPRKEGKYRATLSGMIGESPNATYDNVILLYYQVPEQATYNRWTSKDDNNMVENYLLALRLTDYLRSRTDVNGIYLIGASRTGPIQFVTAALDPTSIAAVDIHVPTSAGIGWQDKPYIAWGAPNGYNPREPEQVKSFTAISAYCDPVNFAPDMKTPWIVAYGLDDDLSPPQGIEAMYHLSPAPWKHISRDLGGHQQSPGFQQLQKDLSAYLKTAAPTISNEKILKEH